MSEIFDVVEELKNTLEFFSEDDISEYSAEQVVQYAADHISQLEVENALYRLAIEHHITGTDFDKWYDLAAAKLDKTPDGEDVSDDELLALLRSVRKN